MNPAGAAALPPPRDPGSPYGVALVCLGNICRSPMAATILRDRAREEGLGDDVRVDSSGTGDWHVGDAMDARAAATLTAHGYDPTGHRARTFDASWFARYDVVLVMDGRNCDDVLALAASDDARDRVQMFRTFDPEVTDHTDVPDVPDPWYGGSDGFENVLVIIERTVDRLVEELARLLRP